MKRASLSRISFERQALRGKENGIQGWCSPLVFALSLRLGDNPQVDHTAWRFLKVGDGRYVGPRANLIGQAKVEAHSNTIEIAYRAHVPMKDGTTMT